MCPNEEVVCEGVVEDFLSIYNLPLGEIEDVVTDINVSGVFNIHAVALTGVNR